MDVPLQEFSWPHLYSMWRMVCEHLASPVIDAPVFLPVLSQHTDLYERRPAFDWWPKHTVNERQAHSRAPHHVRLWETKAGTQHTVELLWAARDNLEQQHAVYILASLWDKQKSRPDAWRGRQRWMLVKSVERTIRQHFPAMERWHHASRDHCGTVFTAIVAQLGQPLRIAFFRQDRMDNLESGHARDIGDNLVEQEIHLLQPLYSLN